MSRMNGLDPLSLIGLSPDQAETRLRHAGVRQIRRTVTAPPRRQPTGKWRVIRCTSSADGTAELLTARQIPPHPSVESALSDGREDT